MENSDEVSGSCIQPGPGLAIASHVRRDQQMEHRFPSLPPSVFTNKLTNLINNNNKKALPQSRAAHLILKERNSILC